MTIRDELKRQLKRLMLRAGVLTTVSLVAIFVLHLGARPHWVSMLFLICFGVAFFALIHFGVRCPRCSRSLLGTATYAGLYSNGRNKVNFCPYCGINFDEPAS